jgi:hypothetical protein
MANFIGFIPSLIGVIVFAIAFELIADRRKSSDLPLLLVVFTAILMAVFFATRWLTGGAA